jgi:plasmid stabilization system protein ParE
VKGSLLPVSRRGALVAAAALLLGRPAGAAAAQAEDTAGALLELIGREQAADFAYRAAAAPRFARLARHAAEHARALHSHLEAVGRPPPAPPRAAGDLDPAAAHVAAAGGDAAAIALERELMGACAAALDRLYDPSSKRTAATIMASHGQHLVVLHRDPLQALG